MLHSEGVCSFCQETYDRSKIRKHLAGHLAKIPAEQEENSYHISVKAAEMFLYILINGEATLAELDDFLRDIWLECCGHMSSFTVKGKKYDYDWDDITADIGENKSTETRELFQKNMTLIYKYDFGSTTMVDIKVIEEYPFSTAEGIQLLSRNEPLEILCRTCKKEPASQICTVCLWEGEGMYCEKCAKKHSKKCEDFEDYAALPVVNSPRLGVCGYEGGSIDTERDGIWQKSKA